MKMMTRASRYRLSCFVKVLLLVLVFHQPLRLAAAEYNPCSDSDAKAGQGTEAQFFSAGYVVMSPDGINVTEKHQDSCVAGQLHEWVCEDGAAQEQVKDCSSLAVPPEWKVPVIANGKEGLWSLCPGVIFGCFGNACGVPPLLDTDGDQIPNKSDGCPHILGRVYHPQPPLDPSDGTVRWQERETMRHVSIKRISSKLL